MKRILTIICIALIAASAHADAMRLYCQCTQEWWTSDDAAIAIYAYADGDVMNAVWPGERMMRVTGTDGMWYAEIDSTQYTNVIFVRVNGSGAVEDWGAKTQDLAIPTDGRNLFTITSTEAVWGDPGVEGIWSVLDESGIPVSNKDEGVNVYSVVGSATLLGYEWDVSSTATEMSPSSDSTTWTYTIPTVRLVVATKYEYKIVADHSWENIQYPTDGNYTLAVPRTGTYQITFTLTPTNGCTFDATLIEDEFPDFSYSKYAVLVNHERFVPCSLQPIENFVAQYLALVQLNVGDTIRMFTRGEQSYEKSMPDLEESGEYANFSTPKDGYGYLMGYYVCNVAGCYSIYFKQSYAHNSYANTSEAESVWISSASTCHAGEDYASNLSAATARISVTDGHESVAINAHGRFIEKPSETLPIGSTVELEVFPNSGYMFVEWSDGSIQNKRRIVVTEDISLSATVVSIASYPLGLLVNGNRFIRTAKSETTDYGYQNLIRAQLTEGETFVVFNSSTSETVDVEMEAGGLSGNFSIADQTNTFVCNVSGCYDVYVKKNNSTLSETIYIGQGTVCNDGVPWTDPNTGYVYSVVGTENLFGTAWDIADTLTNMTPVGDGRFEYTLDSVTLTPEGDYQYKVIANHMWNVREYPSVEEDDNYHITVEESGVYSVLFSLDTIAGCTATTNYLHAIISGDDTGETMLCSTTFADWEAISASSTERTTVYSDITFTLYNVKVRPSERPSSVSDVSVGYINPTSSSSCYIQTDMLPYVSRVTYVQSSANAGRGWRLESSSDGENWYAFNENDEGCASANIAETREMNVYMENVWLRWIPTSTNAGTGIYLHEIAIYGKEGSSSTDPDCPIASGSCGLSGDNLTWVLGCDSVLTISGEGEMPTSYSGTSAPWYEHGAAIKHINIEEGVTKLALYAFYNSGGNIYPNVQTLSIPSTLGAPIENNFFYQCPLKSVTINSDTIVGKASYTSGSSLQNKFGAQVEEYIIGGSVRSIANFAFRNQSPDSLRSIILPEGLEAIGNWAFGYIEHLTSVSIPSTVQTIGTDAFAYCSNLRSVEFGEGLMTVNGQAFWMCDSLTRVTCNALTPPTLNQTAFDHNLSDTLFIPCEAKTAYQEADYWKNFGKIMCADDTIGGNTEPDVPEEYTFTLDANWQFIMLPTVFCLTQDDIVVDGEIEWGIYNSAQRASGRSGWQGFTPQNGFEGSQAYIVRARNGSATLTINIPDQAREQAAVTMAISYHPATHEQNANWNFLGNPYPYNYDIMSALEEADIESPVTIWNGTGYDLFTPGIDLKTLDPFEAFFIQLPDGGSEVLPLSPEHIKDTSDSGNNGNSVADADGALPGYFTINTSKQKVQFSRGNLQYQASTATWQFAENQYDVIGEGNTNISATYDGWIDLFGWGTGDNPTKASTSKCDYSSFVDWGINAISNGGNTADMWRTLSANEWTYITGQRTNYESLCGRATVNGIQGFILLPDDWVSPGVPFQGSKDNGYELNQFTLADWQKMEAAGAVFLPACGGRTGTEMTSTAVQYWSTNEGSSCYAYDIITNGDTAFRLKTNQVERSSAFGVRLVK